MTLKAIVHLVHNANGWWDVRDPRGEVLARYVSEIQGWTAGRALAEELGADLAIHPHQGPTKYEIFDTALRAWRTARPDEVASAALRAAAEVPRSSPLSAGPGEAPRMLQAFPRK